MGCGICSKIKEKDIANKQVVRKKGTTDTTNKRNSREGRKRSSSSFRSAEFKEDLIFNLKTGEKSEISSDGEEGSETDAPKRIRPRSTSRTSRKRKWKNTKIDSKMSAPDNEIISLEEIKGSKKLQTGGKNHPNIIHA